ncbi:MAG: hypothetical protein V3V22_04445, partial [Methylococcales bacterium]
VNKVDIVLAERTTEVTDVYSACKVMICAYLILSLSHYRKTSNQLASHLICELFPNCQDIQPDQ